MSNYDELLADAYYEDDPDFICDDLNRAQDHFQGLLDILYDPTKPLEKIEDHIEEICCALQLKFPKEKRLTIEKKKNPYFEYGVKLMKQSL
jgi:hypothetical protein